MTHQPTGHVRTTDGGTELVLVRTFRAPIADVWASLTEPARVARWYGTVEGETGPGRTVLVTMTAEEGASAEPAHIVECEAPRRLVVDVGDEPTWHLVLDLAEADGVTTLTFTQVLDADSPFGAGDLGPGWEYYADRLQASRDDTPMPDWDTDTYEADLAAHYGGG